ncbi:MAG: hypothetical protein KGJ19_08065 [Betaproteobacteria bacterium]|nr:hypothetical protein [Betaproteobacteria bacterium]MDE2311061.1 hypothetical protein [Betaproteobacteria bacterium]
MKQRTLLSIIAVTGALLFSSYGNAEAQAQKKGGPAAEQPQMQTSSKVKGAITFKGIPLGKPGVKGALQKMCMEKKFNPAHDRCSFNDKSSQILLNYESLVDNFALVTLGSDDALTKVEINSSTPELLGLAKALEAKYGKPQKTSTVIKNAIGTKFDKDTFVWVDDQGSRITIESIFYDFNKGGVVIESAAAIAAQDAAAKKAKEAAKSNP